MLNNIRFLSIQTYKQLFFNEFMKLFAFWPFVEQDTNYAVYHLMGSSLALSECVELGHS